MDNPSSLVSFSAEYLLQEVSACFEGTDMLTVYRLGEGFPNEGFFIFCGLLPQESVEKVLSDKVYISELIENAEFTPDVSFSGEYQRFGTEGEIHGFEPVVISRKWMSRDLDYVEISQDFRLFHDLHHDEETDTYINESGIVVDVSVIAGGYEVQIRQDEMRAYLEAKQLYLSLLFEINAYSEKTLHTLGIQPPSERDFHSDVDNLMCYVFQYRDATCFSQYPSNLYVRGRKFFAPIR